MTNDFESNSGFLFLDDLWACDLDPSLVVRIPAGIDDKQELLARIAQGLDFPVYFGWNWDAFEECLCDLRWIDHQHRIVLLHEGLPFHDQDENRSVYLSILKDAVANWGPGQAHELVVVFPTDCRASVE